MAFQSAVNVGQNQGMTSDRKINLMLENNFNVFILKWKRVHLFQTSMFGLEIVDFMQVANRSRMEVSYKPLVKRGELFFEPDESMPEEMRVPVAYMADTPFNRKYLATQFYSSPYAIAGLITKSGIMDRDAINAEIETYAKQLGVVVPIKSRIVGVYGNSVQVGPEKPPAPADKTVVPEVAAKSVFGSEEKLKEIMVPKADPAVEVVKLTVDQCIEAAEKNTYDRFRPLVDKLQAEKKKNWKVSAYYGDVIEPELKKEAARLLLENGHPLQAQANPAKAEAKEMVA